MYHLQHSKYNRMPEGMYLRMVDDQQRLNHGIKPALRSMCSDKVIIDLGCGTGILGLHALEHGAKFVYFVEHSPEMVEILRNVLPKLIDTAKFKIIHSFAQDLKKSDFEFGDPEICVSELLGVLLFDEGYYHCTAPIKKIFKDLIFIPEIFHLDVYACDVNFGSPPWPVFETQLLEHFKYTYSTIGWSQQASGLDKEYEFVNKKKIGEISYNANTGVFNNNLTVAMRPKDGVMINLQGITVSGGIEESGPIFGWYVYPTDKKVLIDVLIRDDIEDSTVWFTVVEAEDQE